MKKIFFLIISLTLFFTACEDHPAEVGSSLIKDDDRIQSHTLGSEDIRFTQEIIETQIAAGSSYSVLVGKHKTEESIGLLRFINFPEDDTLGNIVVLSADIVLHPTGYYIGDPSNFAVSVYRITSTWDADNINNMSVTGLSQDGTKYGSFSGSVNDTGAIYIPLSTGLVKEWLQLKAAYSSSANNLIQGIMLVPEISSGSLYSFYSNYSNSSVYEEGDNYPYLRVIRNIDGERDTLFIPSAANSYYGFSRNFNMNDQNIVVQSGIAYRTKLTFDISKIPEHVHISNATLTLTLDDMNSNIGVNSVDSLIAYTRVISPINYISYDQFNTIASGYLSINGKRAFDVNITTFVQAWLERKDNQGMELSHLGELVSIDKLSFYSNSAANPEDRPKLKVEYLILPK